MKFCMEAVCTDRKMKTTSKWRRPQNEDDLKKEEDLKNEDDIKNEGNLKNEEDIKNQDRTWPELTKP